MNDDIQVGDRVRCGVFVAGEWRPMHVGIVVQTVFGLCAVDRMSLHGGAPWVVWEDARLVQKEPK